MARQCQSIARNVYQSFVDGVRCENSEIVEFHTSIYGNFTIERAQRYLRRKYKDPTIVVQSVDVQRWYYSMSIEDFCKYGTLKEG